MSNIAIKVENLSKAYQLGEIGTGTISRDLERMWAKARGKEDPFLKIGETNDRASKGKSDIVWSLKDINFEIEQGDAVGIIGRNGAGKSTLLKILSRVTTPTTGKINGKGRIASLLEVGTGFHPELTGRENIFLNGAILGMKKREIQRKLDEIVDFAGVERYLDTPVKRYSSGMYVRLAFAVAAHLESEILIVDEVLAVGDAEFQKKCLGKMGEVCKGEGRTVLFVSHNMGSILSLCNKGVLLQDGNVIYKGTATDTVQNYSELNTSLTSIALTDRTGSGSYRIENFQLLNKAGKEVASIAINETFSLVVNIRSRSFRRKEVKVIFGIYNTFKEGVLRLESKYILIERKKVFDIACNLKEHITLKPGFYTINVAVFSEIQLEDYISDLMTLEISEVDYNLYGISPDGLNLTKILLKNEWTLY